MPIISKIGAKSFHVRMVYTTIFAILIIGAVSMLYPLLLMISGSLKSESDFAAVTPVPRYFWNDDILWMKYVESKYTAFTMIQTAFQRNIGSWKKITPPENIDQEYVAEFREFRDTTNWPRQWYMLGHVEWKRILSKNARKYRKLARERFGSIAEYSKASGTSYVSWAQIMVPAYRSYVSSRFNWPETGNFKLFYEFKAQAPKADWIPCNLDADFWYKYLSPEWGTVEAYNAAHGTSFTDYRQVLLSTKPPKADQARQDWENYVTGYLNLAFIRIDESFAGAYRQFIEQRYRGRIQSLNKYWQTSYTGFDEIPLPAGYPQNRYAQVDLASFIKDRDACPLDALSTYGPRQGFEEFLAKRRGVPIEQIEPRRMPIEEIDYADCMENKKQIRWEFIKRNYLAVSSYLLFHGRGAINTVIFCSLMIGAQLLINPLAAYALSRYKPPSTYKILLFCMVTMAFPTEVIMIPQFLLLKKFPLVPLIVSIVGAIGCIYLLRRVLAKWPQWLTGVLGVGFGVLAGYWLTPIAFERLFGVTRLEISFLNTFWALVLPRMANGFMIFLLKGFFDSLPQELYEAAELDGAGEWTKFWMITMSLSKPILAVLALQAFTMAYSEFMMALVIIPDQKMWTLMIWLFKLQAESHPTVIYASLIIAAVPTFAIFLFCQNIIIRGIVVPTEK